MTNGENILLKKIFRELGEKRELCEDYKSLYETNSNELNIILSSFHNKLNITFRYMNRQLSYSGRRFHADESREAIDFFKKMKSFLVEIKIEKITIDKKYEEIITNLNKFLSYTGGTNDIPEEFDEIQIIDTEPIFVLNEKILIDNKKIKLIPVGKGSYAIVYKYYDETYDKYFALKRLNDSANLKDKERFELEFEITKKIKSPFLVNVYKFNKEKMEYTMDYIELNLFDYINKCNQDLEVDKRFIMIYQIISLFSELEELNICHRDISYKNVLVKCYGNRPMIKFCDFGLVKLETSTLTDPNTEFRGSLNDKNLEVIGLDKYSMVHETYALTRLISFILTGKTNISKISDENIKKFIEKGINIDEEKRYRNIKELKSAIKELQKYLQ